MAVFVVWVLLSVLVGTLAASRGRSKWRWILISMLLSPAGAREENTWG